VTSRAYQTLNDDKKREMYDNYGMSADDQTNFKQQNPGGARGCGHER
jgi:DnaJ-class molecular chaperone